MILNLMSTPKLSVILFWSVQILLVETTAVGMAVHYVIYTMDFFVHVKI